MPVVSHNSGGSEEPCRQERRASHECPSSTVLVHKRKGDDLDPNADAILNGSRDQATVAVDASHLKDVHDVVH